MSSQERHLDAGAQKRQWRQGPASHHEGMGNVVATFLFPSKRLAQPRPLPTLSGPEPGWFIPLPSSPAWPSWSRAMPERAWQGSGSLPSRGYAGGGLHVVPHLAWELG